MCISRKLFAFALAVSAAAPVLTLPTEARAWDPVMHRSDAGADLYLWSARSWGTALTAVPFVQFDPTNNLFINLRFPAAVSVNGIGDNSRGGLGNPTFTIYYSDIDRALTWWAGGRASLPFGLVEDYDWRYATTVGAWSMALYDPFLWAPDTLPIGGLGGIEYRFARFFVLRAGGDLTFFPGLTSRSPRLGIYGDDDFGVHFQTKIEPEFQSRVGVGGGMSIMTVWVPTSEGDNAQVAAMPYFVYDSQKVFFMRVGALIGLDEPLGPGFDRGKVASLYVQLGGHID